MNPLRVLVCGTNYGRIYLEAIRLGGPAYRLVGILARGSTRSQLLARDYGVPLYCQVEDLVPGIDLACAAMGTSGTEVVLSVLSRGIHVLCEHPQRPSQLRAALHAAISRGLCFHVNGHFANLPPTATFITYCRRKSEAEPASFFQVTATDRSLYAALDILHRVIVSFAPYDFHVSSRLQPFTLVQGILGGVPVTLQLQCGDVRNRLPDGSSTYLVDHHIAVGFPSGVLTLMSMNGPVIWNANLNSQASSTEPLFEAVQEKCALTCTELHEHRVSANLSAISALVKNIREGVRPPEQASDYLLEVSSTWEILGALLQK